MPYLFKNLPQGIRSSITDHDGQLKSSPDLIDSSRDGGGMPMYSTSGRAMRLETLPTWAKWPRSSAQDLIYSSLYSVSERLRLLIEDLEPGAHQFKAVEFRGKGAVFPRYWWNVCQRVDTVDEKRTNYHRNSFGGADGKGFRYRAPTDMQPRLVFSRCKIGNLQFWTDKHSGIGWMMSKRAHDAFVIAGITGVEYSYWPEV